MGECMRVDSVDKKIIVYLKKADTSDVDSLCQNIIAKLKKYYDMTFSGFYEAFIYNDCHYGAVIEFIADDLDLYYDYSKVDLHIIKKDVTFLYQIDDILSLDVKPFYYYQGNYYIDIKQIDINNIEFGKLVYLNTDEILKDGCLIEM